MTKFASLTKINTKWSSWKEILKWIIQDFSVIQQKHTLTCPGLYGLIFQSLYHTSLISPGLYGLIFQSLYHTSLISPTWEIDETVNFRNFCKLFTNKFATFFVAQYSFQLADTVSAKKLSANWRCLPFGKFFNIGLNFKNKAFFYIYKV